MFAAMRLEWSAMQLVGNSLAAVRDQSSGGEGLKRVVGVAGMATQARTGEQASSKFVCNLGWKKREYRDGTTVYSDGRVSRQMCSEVLQ